MSLTQVSVLNPLKKVSDSKIRNIFEHLFGASAGSGGLVNSVTLLFNINEGLGLLELAKLVLSLIKASFRWDSG